MIGLHFFVEHAKIHHIGIAVRSIKDLSPFSEIVTDPIQKVSLAFILVNRIEIELIELDGDNSPITESLGCKTIDSFGLDICVSKFEIDQAVKFTRNDWFANHNCKSSH